MKYLVRYDLFRKDTGMQTAWGEITAKDPDSLKRRMEYFKTEIEKGGFIAQFTSGHYSRSLDDPNDNDLIARLTGFLFSDQNPVSKN